MRPIINFLYGEEAVTSVEYAVVLAMILMVVLASITLVGSKTSTLWGNIADSVPQVGGP